MESSADSDSDGIPSVNQSTRRVVIAEDNIDHQRALIESIRKLRPNWRVCRVASSREDLIGAIDEYIPDLLILDVHLLGGQSLDVIDKIDYDVPIIFVTGDPALAAAAYDNDAVDYVLKPIKLSRLERAFSKIDRQGSQARPGGDITTPKWLTALRGNETVVIHQKDILYLQSELKYTRVVTRDGTMLVKKGLGLIEPYLDGGTFYRIHRGTVINITFADALARDDIGRLKVQLKGRPEWLFVSKPFEKVFKTI